MEHKVILAHLRASLLEPVNFEKAKEEILKRSAKPFKTKTPEPPTDPVGTSDKGGPSADPVGTSDKGGPSADPVGTSDQAGPSADPVITSDQAGPSADPVITSDQAGPSADPVITSDQAGPSADPVITSDQAGPSADPVITSDQAGPSADPVGTSDQAGPSFSSAGLHAIAPIASSAGDSAIPASHFSFMSFMNSDIDQDFMYTQLGEDLDPWKQYRESSESLALNWKCDMKTERASVAQDNDLVKMDKYMGWDPEDQLAHLLSMFKKYLKEDMQREEKTYQNYVNKIEKLIGLLFKETGQTLPEVLTEKGLLELAAVVRNVRGKSGEKLKQKTYQTHYSALKAFVIFLERKKYISREIKSSVEEEVSSKIASTAK